MSTTPTTAEPCTERTNRRHPKQMKHLSRTTRIHIILRLTIPTPMARLLITIQEAEAEVVDGEAVDGAEAEDAEAAAGAGSVPMIIPTHTLRRTDITDITARTIITLSAEVEVEVAEEAEVEAVAVAWTRCRRRA